MVSGNYQPLDADLTAIAGLTGTSGFLKKTAANTWSLDTSTYLTSVAFADLTARPTTLSGYGITDAKIETPSGTSNRKITLGSNNFTIYSWALASAKPSYTFSEIGSKPTTIAGYGITDAIQKGEYYMPTNSFGSTLKGMQINSLNDGFYAMDKRTTVTLTGFTSNTGSSELFDADYESKRIISQGGTGVVLIEVSSGYFATYTYGYIYVSFYNNASPASVSIRAYGTKSGTEGWYDYGAATDILNTSGSHCFRAYNGNIYYIKKWEITIVAKSDTDCRVTQIEHSWTRGSQLMMSAVTKFAIKQDLYGEVVAPKFTVRGGTSSQFLKADGSVDSNTYALSSSLSAYLPLTGGSANLITGDIYFDASSANKSIYYKDSATNLLRGIIFANNGTLTVGYDNPSKSKATYIDGYDIYLRYGSTKQYTFIMTGANGNATLSSNATLSATTASITNAEVSGKLAIPTVAPTSPDSTKYYLYVNPNGNYSE